jgi:hypothetical protein
MGNLGGSYYETYGRGYMNNSLNRSGYPSADEQANARPPGGANPRAPGMIRELKIPTSSMAVVVQVWVDKVLGPGVVVKRVEEKDGEITITLE